MSQPSENSGTMQSRGAREFVSAFGERNEQILCECLGWSRDSFGKLAKEGVLCSKRPEARVDA